MRRCTRVAVYISNNFVLGLDEARKIPYVQGKEACVFNFA